MKSKSTTNVFSVNIWPKIQKVFRKAFKLVPNPVEFYIMCSDEEIMPKVEFIETSLNITRAKVDNEVVETYLKALRITPARYPITRLDVKTTTINAGNLNTALENVTNGQLPRRCFIGFVSNEAFNGSFKKNPFYFNNYDLNYLVCCLNGIQYPRQTFQPDFQNGLYARENVEFYRALNQMLTDCHLVITRENDINGYILFGFNLSPDMSDGCEMNGYISEGKSGALRIEVHFRKPLPETINVISIRVR
jgi:hypothetical protein